MVGHVLVVTSAKYRATRAFISSKAMKSATLSEGNLQARDHNVCICIAYTTWITLILVMNFETSKSTKFGLSIQS